MTSEGAEVEDLRIQKATVPVEDNRNLQRIQSNRMMLDLRRQVQWQSQVIRDLKAERDRLTSELASRLFYVEAQLRREQKHIEALLSEKDQYIHFQALQIQSLKSMLARTDLRYRHDHNDCNPSTGRRTKLAPPLSKRFSVALDEYIKDKGIVSRALPVMVNVEAENDKNKTSSKRSHSTCTRTRSMPELRLDNVPEYENLEWSKVRENYYAAWYQNSPEPILSPNVIEELAARRWTSDCDSEHSDSLDSGISSPSIKSRNDHLNEISFPNGKDNNVAQSDHVPCRRSSSIGNFINRTFSSSSTQLEKIKDDCELSENIVSNARRHSSFSGIETKDCLQGQESMQKIIEQPKSTSRFVSSANRNFGTNHRSVTKPRDIKFRKLFKFRRRTETIIDQENSPCDDYMTV
ncbi:uncharacterized protein LOC118186680 [Stegodyphus dumicola]|uniref:uncharacterized protein LOC118186680 n=1 Tax=Stegodyphus dumicola TaxID=202533 RepID=UPI0015B31952|nr:uncharacterized protein LOC118186680 [Stegodyphus dumicola]XP_035212695.1 uncharacterized protein LOC118186680 [Stegodyphus dumicola]